MSAKVWIFLAFVNVVRSRDIIVGSNDIGHKIFEETKHAGPAIWRQMENITITANDTEVISKIVITDLRAEKDGDASIVEGGEGQKNVTIELKSPTVLRGYEFHIEAYAVAEDQLKNMGKNSKNTESIKPKELSSTATPDASITTPVVLDKQLTSTTAALPINEASVNRRQNRDTQNKDEATPEVKNTVPSLTASATEISKVPLANTPTSIQEPDQKFPIVNREFQQGHTIDHPRVNIYEVNKTPESSARSIPSANVKPEQNIHTEGPVATDTLSQSNNNSEINLNTDKLHTHISYPQFGPDSKQSPEPVVNTAAPIVPIVEDKNKNVRHRRDVTNPIEGKKDIQKPLGEDNKADTSETNPLNSQAQKHDQEHVIPGTVETSSSKNPNGHNNTPKSQHDNNEPRQHNAFRNRHLHKRFGNSAARDSASIPSTTENNKLSTESPKISDSTQTVEKFIYSQPSQLGKEQLGITNIPVVSEATTKSGSSTENLANPALKPKVTDSTDTEKPHDFKVRDTRDTTSVTNKGISESLLPPILRTSSSTLKPQIHPKNAQSTNVTSSGAQPILDHSKVPEDKSSSDETSKTIETQSPQTEDTDRNTRDTINTNDKKEKDQLPNDKKDTLASLRTIKPVSTLREHESSDSTKPQEVKKALIEDKLKSNENSPKTDVTVSKIDEDKERQTRDTSAVDESKDSKKESEKTDAAEANTKLHEIIHNNEKPNLENKPTPSSNIDDKVPKHNHNNNHKRVQIPVWNKDDQEEASKIDGNDHENEKQSPKFPREANDTEGSKKSKNRDHPRDISLATDLKIDATEKPTSVKLITNDNKEKDLKSANNENTEKPKEKLQ